MKKDTLTVEFDGKRLVLEGADREISIRVDKIGGLQAYTGKTLFLAAAPGQWCIARLSDGE